jgi:hypothetical protein
MSEVVTYQLLQQVAALQTRIRVLEATGGGGQASIQFQDTGSDIGTSGTVHTVNFTGSGVTASESSGTVTVNVSGGGGGTGNSYFPGGWG